MNFYNISYEHLIQKRQNLSNCYSRLHDSKDIVNHLKYALKKLQFIFKSNFHLSFLNNKYVIEYKDLQYSDEIPSQFYVVYYDTQCERAVERELLFEFNLILTCNIVGKNKLMQIEILNVTDLIADFPFQMNLKDDFSHHETQQSMDTFEYNQLRSVLLSQKSNKLVCNCISLFQSTYLIKDTPVNNDEEIATFLDDTSAAQNLKLLSNQQLKSQCYDDSNFQLDSINWEI